MPPRVLGAVRVEVFASWLLALGLTGCVATGTDQQPQAHQPQASGLPAGTPGSPANTPAQWAITSNSVRFDGLLWRGPLGLHVELDALNVTRCQVESEYTQEAPDGPGPSLIQIGHANETGQTYIIANGKDTDLQAHGAVLDTRAEGVAQVTRTFGNFTSEPFHGTFHLLVGAANIVEGSVGSRSAVVRVTCDEQVSVVRSQAQAGVTVFDDHSLQGDAGIHQNAVGQTSAAIRDGIYRENGPATFAFVNQAANGILQHGDQSGTVIDPLLGEVSFLLRDWDCPCSFDVTMTNVEAEHAFLGMVIYT